MLKYFFACLAVSASLFAELKDPSVLAATDGDPQIRVTQYVNALTGDFTLFQDDYVVPGVEPIPIRRIYVSGDGLGRESSWQFFPQTHLSFFESDSSKTKRALVGHSSGGFLTFKLKKDADVYTPDLTKHGKGATNTAQGEISARTNLKNGRLYKLKNGLYKVVTSDGTERIYTRKRRADDERGFVATSERLPNKNQIFYEYDRFNRLTLVKTTNPSGSKTYAWARFLYADESPDFKIETSDGKLLEYRYKRSGDEQKGFSFRLQTIQTPEFPLETIEYKKSHETYGHLLRKRRFPEGREVVAEYYKSGKNSVPGREVKIKDAEDLRCDRVKTLYETAGPNGELIPTYHFTYDIARKKKRSHYEYKDQGVTEVIDALGCRTIFRFSNLFHPTSIESYDERGAHLHTIQMDWNALGEIERKTLLDADRKEVWTRVFSYDERGNVTQELFVGDLSGTGKREGYWKRSRYTPDNLPERVEEETGRVTLYTYLPGTPLITAQLDCEGEKILKRQFFEYDADHLLICMLSDDGSSKDKENLTGVSYRRIKRIQPRQEVPALGFPASIEERYLDLASGREELLNKTVFTYRSDSKLVRRTIYDANEQLAYSLNTNYDGMGRPSEESNALGQVQKVAYNIFGNPIRTESCCKETITEMQYDTMGRLKQTCERDRDETAGTPPHLNSFTYDTKGRKVAAVDPFGSVTRFNYNASGTRLETELPEVSPWSPKIVSTFDGLGRESAKVDERGDEVRYFYNAYGKHTLILYPDGSSEKFIYNKDGSLAEKVDMQGATTAFSYDIFGREIEKRIYDEKRTLLMSESAVYKGDLVIQRTDPVGHTTNYFYDGAGRKIAEEDEYQRKTYFYDALGRVKDLVTGEGTGTLHSLKEYDFLNRVIEERAEDSDRNTWGKVLYEYDGSGNKERITRFIGKEESVQQFFYDVFNREVVRIDASGHRFITQYDETFINAQGQRVLKKISTNPRGVATHEIFDALGRSTCIEMFGSGGEFLSSEKFFYDLGGRRERQESALISEGKVVSLATTLWENGIMGRLLSLTEAAGTREARHTRYSYLTGGLLEKIIKPDGTVLHHEYDVLGRKTRLASSDQSIDYGYTHDALGRVVRIDNRLTRRALTRTYDKRGSLACESFEMPAALCAEVSSVNTYDALGRRTSHQLFDGSKIAYLHDALFLREVTRLSPEGKERYTHAYTEFDEAGNLLEEELPCMLGTQRRRIDIQGRTVALTSSYSSYTIEAFDEVGNILQMSRGNELRAFGYDDLSQLTREKEETYTYDSHHNRLKQGQDALKHNALNELIETKEALFSYDANGSPLSEKRADETFYYRYDALDRLIEITSQEQFRLNFTYDGMHRRTSKTSYIWQDGRWKEREQLYFLYDDQNEIGAFHQNGKICQLRILGRTPRAEGGSAVALELSGEVLIPQHDLSGNVTALISPATQRIVESYDYTAFGRERAQNASRNPWRYQSKRVDEETKLVYFGRRYYMPLCGRWLTTDPKGYTALSSLYAFCSNNPLTRFDLYGLEDIVEEQTPKESRGFFSSLVSSVVSYVKDVYAFVAETSKNYPAEGGQGEVASVGFTPGIRTTKNDAFIIRKALSDYGGGIKVNLNHSASHGIAHDLEACGWALFGGKTPAVDLMKEQWNDFIQRASPDEKFLQICTSGGCIEFYNALNSSPTHVRERIVGLAIAPAKIIPKEMCHASFNFASVRDFVHYADFTGPRDQLEILSPHPDAKRFDHSISSPTFKRPIQDVFVQHISTGGRW